MIEPFHPERMASRILGMGDVLTLIEKAEQTLDEKKAAEMAERLRQTVEQLGIPHPGNPSGHVTISLGVAADVIEQRLDENGGSLKFSYTLDSGAESFISRNLVDITVDKLPEA